jgi:multiple sugar transport system substrate-binding protein
VAAGGMALTSCGTPVQAGLVGGEIAPGIVDYWDLFGGGDGVRMADMVEGFRNAQDTYGVQRTTLTWGNPYYTKLTLATLGDQPPDVAVSHLTRAQTLVAGGLLQPLPPEALERNGLAPENFTPELWELCQFDGQTMAIPLDTHPFVLFYNTEICEQAGLLGDDGLLVPLNSEEEFIAALQAAKEVTGNWGGVVSVDSDTATNFRIFYSLYKQLGGEILAEEGTQVVIDDAMAIRVLEFLGSVVEQELMPGNVDYGGAVALFASGEAGFYMQGEWEIATFQTAEMPFSMTLFPNIYGGEGNYAVQGDLHTLIVPFRENTTDERLDRSLTFIRSLLEQSMTWALGGHIPAWQPALTSAEYQSLEPQVNYAAAAEAVVLAPSAWYSGSGSTFETVVGSAVATVRSGRGTPEDAVRLMRSGLQALAETPPPV